ncbi:MAG: hypothetical protein JW395_1908 [Nitrospira sp.]|nr:hypothetical protein [Nitrospira sp.]
MRERSLEARLQLAGLDVPFSERMTHVLLRPIGFRLEFELETMSLDEYAAMFAADPDGIDGRLDFVWNSTETEQIESGRTIDCLFDLSKLGENAPDPEEVFGQEDWSYTPLTPRFLEGVNEFVQRWGLIHIGDDDHSLDRSDYCEPWHWYVPSLMARAVLLGLVATDSGELAPDNVVRALGERWIAEEKHRIWSVEFSKVSDHVEQGKSLDGGEIVALSRTFREKARAAAREAFDRNWRQACRGGHGVEFQKALIAPAMREALPSGLSILPVWNKQGRMLELEAFGAESVAAAHLYTLFASPRLGVSVCSVCGGPYPLPEDGQRPRMGRRRFCSESCRDTAKREDKLAAWHRNKGKWRKAEGRNGDA